MILINPFTSACVPLLERLSYDINPFTGPILKMKGLAVPTNHKDERPGCAYKPRRELLPLLPTNYCISFSFSLLFPPPSLPPSLPQGGQHYQASAADGEIGLFPSSAILKRPPVPMVPMPWFHGAISRLDAEKLLDRNQDGQFLLRTSQNTQGVYALAIRWVKTFSFPDSPEKQKEGQVFQITYLVTCGRAYCIT